MSGELRGAGLTVVVAEDDSFTRSLVADGLRAEGFEVRTAADSDAAWRLLEADDVNALISDLDFGDGISGAALLQRVAAERPWVALVVLTSHVSPELAVRDAGDLPGDLVYLVKSRLRHVGDLTAAVDEALTGQRARGAEGHDEPRVEPVGITAAQADVLRMLASGMSTRSIADERGTSVRAAETMIARLFTALGVDDDTSNPRVAALRLWQQGRVRVR
jgi:DNA-binding NarL/FixJ family response regulator